MFVLSLAFFIDSDKGNGKKMACLCDILLVKKTAYIYKLK